MNTVLLQKIIQLTLFLLLMSVIKYVYDVYQFDLAWGLQECLPYMLSTLGGVLTGLILALPSIVMGIDSWKGNLALIVFYAGVLMYLVSQFSLNQYGYFNSEWSGAFALSYVVFAIPSVFKPYRWPWQAKSSSH